ncbi:hypothetical protein P5772_21820 [Bacillus cereus]|uniref:hypothetical protein n=1 Tax=Bacillus cereus TaxID=1396 RepID=UPI000BFE5234|nr:hypothetical protein [Bacillus cereus]MDF9495113.1 hypothetical protein [Bacillus cereus]PGU29785.1 hypothetical protein COD65_07900 [Bacillus cereus]
MQLKQIDELSIDNVGYRSTHGSIKETKYLCPCGKGEVYEEIDYIVGYKNRQINCYCEECDKKYTFKRGGITELK